VSHVLRPGARVVHTVSTAATHGWYDVTVTAATTRRRLAGHLETGHPSTSDPALG
jgi:phospholipase C